MALRTMFGDMVVCVQAHEVMLYKYDHIAWAAWTVKFSVIISYSALKGRVSYLIDYISKIYEYYHD